MKQNLIIIGNGFDLHHHMETQYADYRNYLIRMGNGDIVDCFERVLEDDYSQNMVAFLWSRLEEVIALLPYEQADSLLSSFDGDKDSEMCHYSFQEEIEDMAKYWPGIRDKLNTWIEDIEYTEANENLKRIISNEAHYISFNYTNTLEKLYNIDKSNICYIHGVASEDAHLILGHRNASYYPEWDDSNMDTEEELLNAGKFMEQFRKETYKPIEDIIASNAKFKSIISDYQYMEIYMMGLSYNDTDKPYIKEISKKQNSKWHFVYYSEDDYKVIPLYAEDIGVNNYSVVSYDDI